MQGGRIGIPVFLCTHGCLTFLLRFHASSVDKGMLALLFSQKDTCAEIMDGFIQF